MDDAILNELAAEIAHRECVLFAGAGLSMQGGGPSWEELLRDTANEFDYEGAMLDSLATEDASVKFDYFDIFSDIVRENDKKAVHDYVADKLEGIRLEEPVAKIASYPWFETFTTNYDNSLENELRSRQERNVQRVLIESDYPLTARPANLLHVKLMGTVERGPDDQGSMVLTGDEKRAALDSRSGIFERLEAVAANLSFLFVGYSFEDDLFTDVLRGITANLGTPENTYYALFASPLSESNRAFLESQNVKPIIGDLSEFSEKLTKKVRARDTEDARVEAIPTGNEVLKIDQNEVGDFLSNHNPVLTERFDDKVSIREFFKGETGSLHPFGNDWHFHREEEDNIVEEIISGEAEVISVSGSPGSGRTFLINAAVERLITEHEGMAIEIFNTDLTPIPDSSNFNKFINSLKKEANQLGNDLPKFAVFFSEGQLNRSEILQFQMLRESSNIPIYCIFEAYDEYTPPEISNLELSNVSPNNYIGQEIREDFIDYLVETTSEHKLESLSRGQIEGYLSQRAEFLPVMYRAIYPTQQSIENIVDSEFQNISNTNAKKLVRLCALCSTVGVEVPVSVCRRYLSTIGAEDVSYKDVFDLANEYASALISIREDLQNIQHLSIYHPLIAGYLSRSFGSEEMNRIMNDIAKSVRLKSRHEAAFVMELFITKGVNNDEPEKAPFSLEGLQTAMETLRGSQPARPITHHLGRLMSKRGADPDEFLPVLRDALGEPDEAFALQENQENILTTIAHELWEHKKERLQTEPVNHPEIQEIFDYIERARVAESSLYSYTIQSRILLDMARAQDGEDVVHRVNQAIDIIERGLDKEGNYEWKNRLRRRKVQLWNEIDEEEAEAIADDLLEIHNRGDGYYTLAALYFYEKQEPNKALVRLDRAMEAEQYPPQVPYLRLRILLEEQYGNYEKMLELVRELERRDDFYETWRSAYMKAVVYFINGLGDRADERFNDAWRSAPRSERYGAELFWNENRSHKKFDGIIGSDLTSSEGHIYDHGIEGWDDDIYFNPVEQDTKQELQPGMRVEFELGFSPRGPIGWDLEVLET